MECHLPQRGLHLHDDERRALWLAVLVVVHLDLRYVKKGRRTRCEIVRREHVGDVRRNTRGTGGVYTFLTGPPYLRQHENWAGADWMTQ
jgi:hypothetical protein